MATAPKKPQNKSTTVVPASNDKKVVVKGNQKQAQVQTQTQVQTPVSTQPPAPPSPVTVPNQAQTPTVPQTNNETSAAQTEQPKKEKTEKTKLTEKANLTLNVNAFKKWMKKYFEQNKFFGQKGNDIPKFRGFQVALTAVCEVLCTEVLSATIKQLQKSQSGLYEITRPAIRYAILLDNDLAHLLGDALNVFDKSMTFQDYFCVSEKDMRKFIETHFGKNVNLDSAAYNLLSYLLSKVLIDFSRVSYCCMNYAEKSSLDFKVVKCLIKIKCVGSLENTLTRRIEDTEKLFVPEKEEEQEGETTNNTANNTNNTADNTDTSENVNTVANTNKPADKKQAAPKNKTKPVPQPVDVEQQDETVEGVENTEENVDGNGNEAETSQENQEAPQETQETEPAKEQMVPQTVSVPAKKSVVRRSKQQ